MNTGGKGIKKAVLTLVSLFTALNMVCIPVSASELQEPGLSGVETKKEVYGGGYAITGQIGDVGYTSQIYDASNGLPTSDANCCLCADSGYVYIGGYSGVIRYDGSTFERLDPSEGLTSARGLFEDSKGRIWVGTNDNGVVILDRDKRIHITYKDGLPSSSIRQFAEDNEGNVFIGTTAGVCYADKDNNIHSVAGGLPEEERVLRLDRDVSGRIYGQTSSGLIFAIDDREITEIYTGEDLGTAKITTILADPDSPGKVYFGTEGSLIYYGDFGDSADKLEKIRVTPIEGIHWLSYDCGRIFVSSTSMVGFIDKNLHFKLIENISQNSGIEMTTSDYQGNIWAASSTQGVMKIVTDNFVDITGGSGLPEGVVNAVCMYNNQLYIGTDNGLDIIGEDGGQVKNLLAVHIGDARIRCIKEDGEGNLWIATYSNNKGLVSISKEGSITNYTTGNGLPDNQVRCITFTKDGRVLAGTNGGLAIIKDGKVTDTVDAGSGIKNTVFLTVEELGNGQIAVGTDGDGIYLIDGKKVSRIGRDEGLTSDVVMRISYDRLKDVYWIVTSNSIEYMKHGVIYPVTSFPYTNNYDIYSDDNGNAWILSSYGIYCIRKEEMLIDDIKEFRIYTIANGMPYAVTGNSYSFKDKDGNLFIPGRNGVIRVNINNFFEEQIGIKMDINSVYCEDERIYPGEDGVFRLPSSKGRIQINPSVMDYTMLNPTIKMYLEGGPDEGITVPRNRLSALEYTALPYGEYTLHIDVLDPATEKVLQDESFSIVKTPGITELFVVRLLVLFLLLFIAGLIVWWVMRTTVISRQYGEIRKAKEDADRANTAKSRFLANMSHEIRTPINTIMGMNEMVMREDASGVPKGYFMSMMNYAFDIRNASESLLGLINDLLDISKIESGKMHLVEQEYDTIDMFRSIVAMIRVRSTEKELTFDVVIDELLPKRLYGDQGKIKQILLNLLTNAVKYTDKGGFILSVDMEERENDVCAIRFSVKDTGKGVKEEDMEKLFAAYERLEEEKNSGIQGTGLGLDISRRFAELLDGKLWCESVYGEGSEFILCLKQRIVDASPIGVFIEHDESSEKGPYIPKFIAPDADILVVDDNPMNLSVIKGLLKATKVFVTTASGGEEALEKIKDTHFDVVLLDHMMPGMDGVETVEKIRETLPDLPVYALTANTAVGEDFYRSKGFNGYLSKPVESSILEKTIMQHLPEEIMEIPEDIDAVEDLKEIPGNMQWIYETEGISVPDGIRNSGGISNYIFSLDLFLDTIDGNAKVISDSYENGDLRLFTIKVHSLKSSARIIGAGELSRLAEKLEEAGNKQDTDTIDEYAGQLLSDYLEFKDKLKKIKDKEEKQEDKKPIQDTELKEAIKTLSDVIPQMDYDSAEMILNELSNYALPKEAAELTKKLETLLKSYDWEGMENLINGC